jgi:hypothetical protein
MSGIPARRLWFLEKIAEATDKQPHILVPITDLGLHEGHSGDVQALERAGLLHRPNCNWPWDIGITHQRLKLLRQVQKQRENVVERRKTARMALARWMYQQQSPSDLHLLSDWLESDPTFYGAPFTEEDAGEAAKWLLDSHYLAANAITDWIGIPQRAGLNPEGQAWVEAGGKPPVQVAGGVNVTNIGGNVAVNSPNAMQTVSSDTLANLRFFVELVSAQLPELGLTDTDQQEVSEILEEITQEADAPTPEKGRLRTLVSKTGGFLGRVASGASGGVIATMITNLLAALG